MPASYAHYRFGSQVLPLLPPALRARIERHRTLFDIGLHGPDIFFYHQPLWKNKINQVGHTMHRQTGGEVFVDFLKNYRGTDEEFSYLAGFLCHFALDSSCHGYVEQMAAMGISHALQETQLDRALLLQDGEDPLRRDLVAHIVPTEADTAVIAGFFPRLTMRQTAGALSSMVFYHHLLLAPGGCKRKLLLGACRMIGAQDSFGSMVMQQQEVPSCTAIVRRLLAMYEEAKPLAATLIAALPQVQNRQYQYDFEGNLHPGGAEREIL